MKFYIKIGNVYIGRKWFIDRFGRENEGSLCAVLSRLTAVKYDSLEQALQDLERINAHWDDVSLEKVG